MSWDWFTSLDTKVTSAIIAGGVSFSVAIIGERWKRYNEKRLHIEKLTDEHQYEEQRKIKESISKNKVQLLNAAESLNHRIWNLTINWEKEWHSSDNPNSPSYYQISFYYRLLNFFWWVFKVDKELVYLDTTLANASDLDFIKFLRLFPDAMCQVTLFDGVNYNTQHDTDHFFRHDLEKMVSAYCQDDDFPEFQEFESKFKEDGGKITGMVKFIDGIKPNEKRLRWTRLYSLQLLIMTFSNIYGYEFQYSDATKYKEIAKVLCKHKDGKAVLSNLYTLISNMKLSNNEHIRIMSTATKAAVT